MQKMSFINVCWLKSIQSFVYEPVSLSNFFLFFTTVILFSLQILLFLLWYQLEKKISPGDIFKFYIMNM